jgi:hypothetical protein
MLSKRGSAKQVKSSSLTILIKEPKACYLMTVGYNYPGLTRCRPKLVGHPIGYHQNTHSTTKTKNEFVRRHCSNLRKQLSTLEVDKACVVSENSVSPVLTNCLRLRVHPITIKDPCEKLATIEIYKDLQNKSVVLGRFK